MKKKHASEITKEKSQQNIMVKIEILRRWSKGALPWRIAEGGNFERDENGDKIVEWFPSNHSEFCRWDGSQCSIGNRKNLPVFRTIGRDTFYKEYNSEFNHSATSLYQTLKLLKKKMNDTSSNFAMVKNLSDEVDYLTTVVESESNFVLNAMKRIDEAETALRREKMLRKNNEEEYERIIFQLKTDNEQLRINISELNKSLSTLIPLRAIKNEK